MSNQRLICGDVRPQQVLSVYRSCHIVQHFGTLELQVRFSTIIIIEVDHLNRVIKFAYIDVGESVFCNEITELRAQ